MKYYYYTKFCNPENKRGYMKSRKALKNNYEKDIFVKPLNIFQYYWGVFTDTYCIRYYDNLLLRKEKSGYIKKLLSVVKNAKGKGSI